MLIGAISGSSGVGPVQSDRPAGAAPDPLSPVPPADPAEPVSSAMPQPLSPMVLATLIGQQVALCGSSYSA
jgi:hypothetical protein